METRASYTAVGLFVILASLALVAAGLWLGADLKPREYQSYLAYMEHSVAGLNPDAPVLYRGVPVGRVGNIRLAADDPSRVRLLLEIRQGTPIRTDTVATLRTQGLTGVSYVELTGGSRDAPDLTAREGEPYPVLQTEPPLLNQLKDQVVTTLETLNDAGRQTEKLLSDDNLQSLNHALRDLETVSAMLARNSDAFENTIRHAETIIGSGAEVSEALPGTLADLEKTLARMDQLIEVLEQAGQDVSSLSNRSQAEVERLSEHTVPEINGLIRDIDRLSTTAERFTRQLEENPNMLIYGQPPQAPGPGE